MNEEQHESYMDVLALSCEPLKLSCGPVLPHSRNSSKGCRYQIFMWIIIRGNFYQYRYHAQYLHECRCGVYSFVYLHVA